MNAATSQRPLPHGWRWVRLGEVSTVISKGTTPTTLGFPFTNEGIPFLRAEDIVGGPVDSAKVKFRIAPETDAALLRSRLHPGDLLVTIAGTLGRIGYVPENAPRMNCNQAVAFARLLPELADSLFVCFACQTYEVTAPLQGQKAGGTIQNLNLQQVGNLLIPLPPLPEQRRIAAILSEQMEAVERARAAAQARLEAAKALPAAYLRAVFDSPEAQQWPRTLVSELCDQIDYGFTASADFTRSEPRFLRITDIQNGHVDWEIVPGCQINRDEEVAHKLADGDIVFARTGATTGKSFLVKQPPRAVFASYLIRLRPSKQVASDFLYAFFQSDDYWQQIRASARGGAQPNVNATLLGAITVPIGPLAEQQRITAILSEQMEAVERAQKALQEELDTINKLPAALLRRAFSGGL